MRSIFTTAAAGVIAGVGLLTFDASPINAALFAVGPNGGTNLVCMDVLDDNTAAGTPVIAYDCHNGDDQQFEFGGPDCVMQTASAACQQYPRNVPPGTTIYTVPSNLGPTESASHFNCLTVSGAGTANGTPVISNPCNGGVNQQFIYNNGQILVYESISSPKCLDATDMANFTQIIINDCTSSPSQQWQIMGAFLTNGPPNGVFGGDVCASANPPMPVTPTVFPLQAGNCHVAPNQRFDFIGYTIYTNSAQRCMSVGGSNSFCDGSTDQQFYYSNGLIVSVETGQCLDVNLAQSKTLFFANCDGSDSQQWQIK
jgi:hypothetical protein